MAVLDEVPGVEITVQVAGRDATEYDDPDAAQREPSEAAEVPTSIKYIECVGGAEFTITTRVQNTYGWGYMNHSLSSNVYVDGKSVNGHLISQSHLYNGLNTRITKGNTAYDHTTGQWLLQRFKFSAISTVDDAKKERVENDIKRAQDLGSIEVKIFRCLVLGKSHSKTSIRGKLKSEIAEKALKGKAVSHGASYSSEKSIAPNRVHVKNIDDEPIGIFQFRYRSRDALKREMVIPRTPSPGPAPDPEIAQMSREELQRLAAERLNQLRGIKEERKPVIKREIEEVIDLTDDNERPKTRRRLEEPEEAIDLTED